MKFFAATALALAAATANAEVCDLTKLPTLLGPVISPALTCQSVAKFQIVPPVALPTAEQVKDICSKCTDLIAAAKTVTFPECTFPLGGEQVSIAKIFNTVAGQCTGAAAGASANATTTAPAAGANATTEAPAATTVAPAATTVAPDAQESSAAGSKAGSAGADEDVKAPESSTSKPAAATPAPTKSAGVSATLGAAVAVACSIAAFVL